MFKTKRKLRELQTELDSVRFDRDLHSRRADACEKLLEVATEERDAIQKRKIETNRELSALRKKLREQTEADILLNALQAVGIVPAPEPAVDYQARQELLRSDLERQQAAMSQRAQNPFGPSVLAAPMGRPFGMFGGLLG